MNRFQFAPRLLSEIRSDSWFTLTVLTTVAVAAFWSIVSVARFYALAASVYDLGTGMQDLWAATQFMRPTPEAYVVASLYSPVAFALSPLSLFHSYPLLLTFQSVSFTLSTIPLFFIARDRFGESRSAFAISLAYVLYFPAAGVYWFDFHFESLFVPLFILGYFFYLRGHYRAAFVLLFLSGTTWYPYILLIALFAIVQLVFALGFHFRSRLSIHQTLLVFNIVLLCVCSVFFVFQYLTYNAPLHSGPGIQFGNRLVVLVLVLTPVLFLPLLSIRWVVMLCPFVYLELTAPALGFSYPFIFADQYSTLFIPFIFLGSIEGIAILSRWVDSRPGTVSSIDEQWRRVPNEAGSGAPSAFTISILIVSLGLAAIFQPYGPLNDFSTDNFAFAESTAINWTQFDNLQRLVDLVPGDSPYVLFQNDMPELLPRPLAYENTPLVTFIDNWGNISVADALSDKFPLTLTNGQLVSAQIEYAIDNPYGNPTTNAFFNSNSGVDSSMYSFVRTLYSSGAYGVLAQVSGMMILQRGYVGPVGVYSPYATSISASQAVVGQSDGVYTNGSIMATNPSPGATLWEGPNTTLSPGLYQLRLTLITSNTSFDNKFYLNTTVSNGKESYTIASLLLNGSSIAQVNRWVTVVSDVYLNNTFTGIRFTGVPLEWSGELGFQSIRVAEVGPPATIFTPEYRTLNGTIG